MSQSPLKTTNTDDAIREQLSILDTISEMLTDSSFELDRLLQRIVELTAETMQAKGCAVRLLDFETGEMMLKAVHGLSDRFLSKGPVMAEKSVYQEMIEQYDERGEVVEIYDVSSDPRVQYTEEAIEEGISSLLAAPLLQNDRVIGALSVLTETPTHFSSDEIRTFQTIANQAAIAIHLAQLHENELELKRIEQELRIASDIQSQMMPAENPTVSGFDIAGWSHPCNEVGGDFYDFIQLRDNSLGIAVGDVSGKGIPAALLMVTLRTSLRVQTENLKSMPKVIQRVNRALYNDTQPEEFATLFFASLQPENRTLTYVNAGHDFPILVRKNETLSLQTGGTPVGLFPEMEFSARQFQLQPEDLLVIYTDGFTEAQNATGEQFGPARLLQHIRDFRHLAADKIVRILDDKVKLYAEGNDAYCDDRTIVVLKFPQSHPSPSNP
jgi:serine phosphatase RsbU (regulator of sigma subunit)